MRREKKKVEKNIYDNYLAILREEMVPAMGCTEPIALAYGAARAREVLGREPVRWQAMHRLIWRFSQK